VREVREDGFARWITIAAPPELLRYVVEKGSIAVDGISLTVAAVDEGSFGVSLIPETLARTTLGHARPGAGPDNPRPRPSLQQILRQARGVPRRGRRGGRGARNARAAPVAPRPVLRMIS